MAVSRLSARTFFLTTLVFSLQGSWAFASSLHDQAIASARAGRHDSAIAVLERLVRQEPENLVYLYDLIAVLSWSERHSEAISTSEKLLLDARVPDYVLTAVGKSAVNTRQTDRALQAYRLLSSRRPKDADASQGLARAQAQANQDAKPSTVPQPDPVRDQSLGARQDANGQHIREARVLLDQNFTLDRYRLIDAALAENAALIAQAQDKEEADVLYRLRSDRVVALRDRGFNLQAIEAFKALDVKGTTPAYAVAAAAEAYLNQRLPQQAIVLFKRAIEAEPANSGWRMGLMYAELEAENFLNAQRIAEADVTASGHAAAARRNHATFLRLVDRLDPSQTLLSALSTELPNDVGLWLEQGDLLARRGLPRAAAARFSAVLAQEPDSIKARVGLADALWAQGAVVEAGEHISALNAQAPEHPAVQRLVRAWQRGARALLSSSFTIGFGQGFVAGNDDLSWDSTLFSGMTAGGTRLFANHHKAKATFNGQSARHERMGAGLEWTQRDLQSSIELGRDLHNAQDVVWAVSAAWQVNDELSLRLRHESQTNDFPLKARLPDAEQYLGAPTYLHADKTLAGVAYRWNESRRVAFDMANYSFNDGNDRKSFSASWFERFYSGYGRTLDLVAAAYSSTNTLRDAIYFSPKRDVAWSATLTGDWLTWQLYERSLNQRLAFTAGTYRQTSDVSQGGVWAEQHFGWNTFQDLRYEHEWQFGPDFSTRYGLGARRFPYDGVHELKNYVYAHVNWRF